MTHEHLSPHTVTGTQDRIVMITGDPSSVTHAVSLVVEHLHSNAVTR